MLLLKTLQASKIVKRRRWFDGDAKRLWREWLWLKIKSLERNPASAKQEWNRRFGAIQAFISFQEQIDFFEENEDPEGVTLESLAQAHAAAKQLQQLINSTNASPSVVTALANFVEATRRSYFSDPHLWVGMAARSLETIHVGMVDTGVLG